MESLLLKYNTEALKFSHLALVRRKLLTSDTLTLVRDGANSPQGLFAPIFNNKPLTF